MVDNLLHFRPAKPALARRALPPESPLDMPRRKLHEPRRKLRAGGQGMGALLRTGFSRLYVGLGGAGLAVYGAVEMYGVLSTATVTPLQWVFLALFSLNFAWISFAFMQASLGFLRSLKPAVLRPPELEGDLPFKTAILLPVYNEDPRRIAAGILAMRADLAEKQPGKFAFFILSDTNKADAWLAEEDAFRKIIDNAGPACPVYYRRRMQNDERKAGNIADWVRRWGGAYEAMLVLDADSVLSAETLMRLARRLAAAPGVGLIQTLPYIIGAKSLYGRAQQFANHCFGPIYARGLAAWHGLSSNFWGHNAIIRTRAFAAAAGLPLLRGRPPFGGHVLSHDFIEAAQLRRAGWGVRFDTDIGESYEEAPPSLADVLIRDRRWCQGNLQHSRFLFARGLSFPTRLHLLSGIMSYLSAALWLLLVLVGLAIAVQASLVRPEYFAEPSLFPTWPVFDSARAKQLFIVSMGIVLAPKVFGWLAALANLPLCWRYGGPVLLTLSVMFETLLSALYAPILMVAQFHVIWAVLLGHDSGWRPQRRDDGALGWRAAFRAHRGHMLFGLALAALSWELSNALFYWLLPISAGLILSVPLSWLSGGARRGRAFAWLGLLRTPPEKRPAPILAHMEAELAALPPQDDEPALWHLRNNPALCQWHLAQLPETPDAHRLGFEADRVTALWKADHVEALDDLVHWLSPRETLALLAQPSFVRRVAAAQGGDG